MANDVSVVWARFCHRRSTQPSLGNGTGCPGVFLRNLCPYPSEPVPVHKGRVLTCMGHGLGITHGYQNPRKPPTSRRDSLVVAEGRWRPRKPPTSRRDSLVVVEGRW